MNAPSPLITTAAGLAALCERLADAPVIAVDTEFMREKTYFARLCLIQLATPSEHALVDPVALKDLDALRAVLVDGGGLKVFHSGRQDLEIFHDLWTAVPNPVFDTQLAASVLGIGDQLSYAALVREVTGAEVSKAEGLTDWSRRPLSPAQMAYAAADVTHLVEVYAALSQRVAEAGRAKWMADALRPLEDPATYLNDPREAWRSVKRSAGLRGGARAVLQELAAWREETARRRDLPRRWVLSDEAIIDVAKRAPETLEELATQRRVPPQVIARDGRELLERVALALAAPAAERPPRTAPVMTEDARAVADLMACLVRLRARERDVSVSVIANRGSLEAVALLGEESEEEVLTGWKRELVGEDLLKLRDGGLRLVVTDGVVTVEPA